MCSKCKKRFECPFKDHENGHGVYQITNPNLLRDGYEFKGLTSSVGDAKADINSLFMCIGKPNYFFGSVMFFKSKNKKAKAMLLNIIAENPDRLEPE